METDQASLLFGTLGNAGRLRVFRLLMRRAPQGVRPGEIGEALDIRPSTLSVYLSALEGAGLIQSRREGRAIYYSVDIEAAGALTDFFIADCCRGRPDIYLPAAAGGGEAAPAMPRPLNVMFMCTGNSARSIIAEAILAAEGAGRFRAHSAGTRPYGEVNPMALDVLRRKGHDVAALRSKSVAEFQGAEAPAMDFVFTICDRAAAEECPRWPGQPMNAHWGVAYPCTQGHDAAGAAAVLDATYAELQGRVRAFMALPLADLGQVALQHHLDKIGLNGG